VRPRGDLTPRRRPYPLSRAARTRSRRRSSGDAIAPAMASAGGWLGARGWGRVGAASRTKRYATARRRRVAGSRAARRRGKASFSSRVTCGRSSRPAPCRRTTPGPRSVRGARGGRRRTGAQFGSARSGSSGTYTRLRPALPGTLRASADTPVTVCPFGTQGLLRSAIVHPSPGSSEDARRRGSEDTARRDEPCPWCCMDVPDAVCRPSADRSTVRQVMGPPVVTESAHLSSPNRSTPRAARCRSDDLRPSASEGGAGGRAEVRGGRRGGSPPLAGGARPGRWPAAWGWAATGSERSWRGRRRRGWFREARRSPGRSGSSGSRSCSPPG
jgi:hypothetical protein